MRNGRAGSGPIQERADGRAGRRWLPCQAATRACGRYRRRGAPLALLLTGSAGAAAGCVLATEGLGEPGTVAPGTGGSAGAGGAVGECQQAEDCPGEDTDCRSRACIDRACLTIDAPVLTECDDDGGHVCDGAGQCLLALGDPCESATECLSNHCADGNCCTTACEGGCEICSGTNPPGTCAPHDVGGDPEHACGSGGSCDGSGGCARGELLWQEQFGGLSAVVSAWGVAADGAGHVIVAGTFAGDAYFGSALLSSGDEDDGFVAKLDPNGDLAWVVQLNDDGDDDAQRALDVAVAANGDVIVVGDYVGSIRLGNGGELLTSAGEKDGFVASFSENGAFGWAHSMGGTDEDRARRVAVGPDGQVLVAGDFRSETMTVGATGLDNASAGDTDFFLASLTGDGEHSWARSYGDADDQCPVDWACLDIAVGDDGSILLAGAIVGQVDLGGGPIGDVSGLYSAVVGQLQSDGEHWWSQGFANGDDHRGANAVVFASPDLGWITGNYWGNLALGGDCVLPTAEASGSDFYFASFNLGATGSCEYSYAYQEPLDQVGTLAAADALGNLILAGRYQSDPTIEGTTWPYASVDSVFLLKRSSSGGPLWSRGFASGAAQEARAMAVRPDRSIVVAGQFQTTIDLHTPASGLGPMTAYGTTDAFVAVFEP